MRIQRGDPHPRRLHLAQRRSMRGRTSQNEPGMPRVKCPNMCVALTHRGVTGRAVLLLFAAVIGGAAVDDASASVERIRVTPDDRLQAVLDEAPEGADVILTAGAHRGPVTIARRVTLRGEDGARLHGTGEGSVLTIDANGVQVDTLHLSRSGHNLSDDDAGVLVLSDDVRLTSLHLERNLHGIYVRGGENAVVKDNHVVGLAAAEDQLEIDPDDVAQHMNGIHHRPPGTQSLMGNGIHLWNADGAVVVGNRIEFTRDGIYVAHTNQAVFRDNRIHDSRYGIHYMYSSDNVVAGNELWANVAGAALMFSRNLEVTDNILREHSGFRAYGLLLQDVDASVFERNTIRGNRVGMRLQASSANTFQDNDLVGNLAGMTINSSSRENSLTRNRIGPNLRQLELTGPVPPTDWSIDGVGNRWYGAMPLDLTGDGISQWPHHEVDVMAERRESFPYVQLLTGSPGIGVVEWSLTRAPVPGMRKITDYHPLVRGRERDHD